MFNNTLIQSLTLLNGTHQYQLLSIENINTLNGNLGIQYDDDVSFEIFLNGNNFVKLTGKISTIGLSIVNFIFKPKGVYITIAYDELLNTTTNITIRLEQVNGVFIGRESLEKDPTDKIYDLRDGIMMPDEALSFHKDNGITLDILPKDIARLSSDQEFTGQNIFTEPLGIPSIDGKKPKYGYMAFYDGRGLVLRSPSSAFPNEGVGGMFFSLNSLTSNDVLILDGKPFDPLAFPELAKIYPSHILPDMRGRTVRGIQNVETPKSYIGSDTVELQKENLPRKELEIDTTAIFGSTTIDDSTTNNTTSLPEIQDTTVKVQLNTGLVKPINIINQSILGYWYIVALPTTRYYNDANYKLGQTIMGSKTIYDSVEFPCIELDGSVLSPELAATYPDYVKMNGGTRLKDANIYTEDYFHGEQVPTAEHILGEKFDRIYRIKNNIDAIHGTARMVILNAHETHYSIIRSSVKTNNGEDLVDYKIFINENNQLAIIYTVNPTHPVDRLFVEVDVLLNIKDEEVIAEKYIKLHCYGVLSDFGCITAPTTGYYIPGTPVPDQKAPIQIEPRNSLTMVSGWSNIGGHIYTITCEFTMITAQSTLTIINVPNPLHGKFAAIGVNSSEDIEPEVILLDFDKKTNIVSISRGSNQRFVAGDTYGFTASFVF